MSNRMQITGLSNAITQALAQYTTEVEKGLEEEKKSIAKKAVQTLKATSPKGATGDYAKGWAIKNINGKYVVHNKTNYQLTHLLEYGHAKRNGGRVAGKPHIRPVEEQTITDFTNAVERVIRNGS